LSRTPRNFATIGVVPKIARRSDVQVRDMLITEPSAGLRPCGNSSEDNGSGDDEQEQSCLNIP
jgi:hypothetical protein